MMGRTTFLEAALRVALSVLRAGRVAAALIVTVAGVAASLMLTPARADAQPAPGLHIVVEAMAVGNEGSFGSAVGAVVPHGTSGTYERSLSISPAGCAMGSGPYIVNEAVGGWHVWVTPVAARDDAVTFRILWERSPNGNMDPWNPGTEQTFTLTPGTVIPLDVISAPPRVSPDRTCSSVRLQVQVRRWPDPDEDRRLVATDLTLVQRLADGAERTHSLTLRTLFDEEARFHFDTLDDSGVQLEFQGVMTIRPDSERLAVEMTTRSRAIEDGVVSHILRDGAMMRGREVKSSLRLAPDETVDIELPRLGENASGAFVGQTFLLKVRSRQLR